MGRQIVILIRFTVRNKPRLIQSRPAGTATGVVHSYWTVATVISDITSGCLEGKLGFKPKFARVIFCCQIKKKLTIEVNTTI